MRSCQMFRFLSTEEIITIHDKVIKKYGGGSGIHSEHLLESALANPQNLFHYHNSNVYEVASSYATSIVKNHPFIDGNKRTGFGAMDVFLRLNGIRINFSPSTVDIFVDIATNKMHLSELAQLLITIS